MKTTKLLCMTAIITIASFSLQAQDKQSDKRIPDFSQTPRKDVPVQYTWKIDDIYASKSAWEADREQFRQMIAGIDDAAKNWTSSPQRMMNFLKLLNDIGMKGERLYWYAGHQSNADIGNTEYTKMKGEIQNMFVQLGSRLSFFNEDVLKLGIEKFTEYKKQEAGLADYTFSIESILHTKDHVLPADQSRIVALTGLFSGSTGEAANVLNDLELPQAEVILSDGSKVSLNYANYMFHRASKIPADRTAVMKTFWDNQQKFENTHAVLLDGAMKQHWFSAQVHNYPDCLTARLFGENIPNSVYTNLIKGIRANLNPMHRYIALKQKLLKLEKFRYEDVYASAVPGVDKVFGYDEARKLIIESMKPLGKDYTDMLLVAFDNRWIDIYPNQGKESGAYSAGLYGIHPYIKMNYNGEFNAVSTLTHELGHALHSHYSSKTQNYTNSNYPTFLAEIASTFNENLLIKYMLKAEKDDLFKLYILDKYLDGMRGTIYRQTLFAEFELSMHQRVEQGQTLTADWLNSEYLRITRDYYGHDKGVCVVDDYIQHEWTRIPHFYMNYYVFQYSTGLIASLALSDLVLNGGEKERQAYIGMLSAGGNGYPIDILKKAGVDMTTDAPYQAAFRQFDQLVTEMEKLVEKLEKEKKI